MTQNIPKGTPDAIAFPLIFDRLMTRRRVTASGCWEYSGTRSEAGYGQISFRGTSWPVHRLVYTIQYGPIPSGMVVCHSCDNTSCFNPKHLSVATQRENLL